VRWAQALRTPADSSLWQRCVILLEQCCAAHAGSGEGVLG
jgi:hypothetical protein